MNPGHEYGKRTLEVASSDLVEFRFKLQDGKVVRTLKSFLSSRSPVFAIQFSDTWNGDTIEIDDPVTFNQHEKFLLFIQVLAGLTDMVSISVQSMACLYFYAEKYQIDKLKTQLMATLPNLVETFNPSDLLLCLEFVAEHNFSAVLNAVDGIKLGLNAENGVQFFDICSKFKMEKLIAQVVNFMATVDYDSSWPSDLLRRIANKNRIELKEAEEVIRNLSQYCSWCRHEGKKQAQFCQKDNNCRDFWNRYAKKRMI